MRKTYKYAITKKHLYAGISAIICFTLVLTQFLFLSGQAYANVNKEDLLYGETVSQRGLTVGDCPSISSKHAGMIDKNGNLIYERDSKTPVKIASLTKIMTAIVALENSSLTDELTVSEASAKVGESSAGLWKDDTMTVETALYALMVPSGNDAAVALAEYVGQKLIDKKDVRILDTQANQETENNNPENSDEIPVISDKIQAFVRVMNKKADELRCENTLYTNPHGLDNDEYASDAHSCAYDMLLICKYAMENETFKKIVGGGDTTITVTRSGAPTQIQLQSTDILLGAYEGCIGIKTGITDEAGPCFAGAWRDSKDNAEIYTVVLNAEDEAARFIDTQELFDWYSKHKVDYKLANSKVKAKMNVDGQQKEVNIVARIAHPEWADCKFDVALQNDDETIKVIDIAGNIHQALVCDNVHGSYKSGDEVGQIIFTQHNKTIAKAKIVAVNDQPGPNIFQMIGVGIDRIIRSITNQPTQATSELLNESVIINNKNSN